VGVRFGEFVFDSGSRELRGRGGPCHLSPKAFECLGGLLERRPEAVRRAQLQGRLWPKTFVADSSLRRVIAGIRAALGDDERRPRFIRTVRGFGYAFCGATAEEGAGRPAGGRQLVSRGQTVLCRQVAPARSAGRSTTTC